MSDSLGGFGMQPNMNIDFTKLANIECSECSGVLFDTASRIKRIPAFMTGEGREGFAKVPVMVCRSCDHVLRDLDPDAVNLSV